MRHTPRHSPASTCSSQLSDSTRRMLGIKVDHTLEEVTLRCLVQRPQLLQGSRIDERQVGGPVGIGRSCLGLAALPGRCHSRLNAHQPSSGIAAPDPLGTGRAARSCTACGSPRPCRRAATLRRPSPITCAVMATIGIRSRFSDCSACRMVRAAVKPSICGMLPSIRMMSCERFEAALTASSAVFHRLDLSSQSGQRLDSDLAIDRAVVREQHPEVRESRQWSITSLPDCSAVQAFLTSSDTTQQLFDFGAQKWAADRSIGRAVRDDCVGGGIPERRHRHHDGNSPGPIFQRELGQAFGVRAHHGSRSVIGDRHPGSARMTE